MNLLGLALVAAIAIAPCVATAAGVGNAMPVVGRLAACEAVQVDGILDESCWASATWNGPFQRLANEVKDRSVAAQTKFAMLADARTLYIAAKCTEPDMDALRAHSPGALYVRDEVEVFLDPRGDGFNFYHFVVAFDPRTGSATRYVSEGGNIEPDPYGPDWTFARGECDGGWCVEMAIPLSSFYMTRNGQWRDEWRVNVARVRTVGGFILTTWSPLKSKFIEPGNFRKVGGFPNRPAMDDVAVTDAAVEIASRSPDGLSGRLSFTATVAEAGEYEVTSSFSRKTEVSLESGENAVSVPCVYPANGRHPTKISLKRRATGETYSRTYLVAVDFDEIRLTLASPEYRGNFYPGQVASRVRGRIDSACGDEVSVAVEGPGFPRREVRLPQGGGEFDFDTRGFSDGTATLSVVAGSARREFKIRKLAKTGRRMAWISRGRLVVDGKPVLRRNVYAKGYMGGMAFAERFANDKRLYNTPEISSGGTLEPSRVIKGLEAREGRKDVMPCKEYLDKIDAMIDRSKDRDFVYWYICDEPEYRGVSPVYLRNIYEHVKEKDPYHVVLMATTDGKKFIGCADWFETHPYINPRDDGNGRRILDRPISKIGAYIDAFNAASHPDKCVGFLPTMFAYRWVSVLNDYPTFPEYVCHTWAAVMRGAKTLWPYAYHDMGDRASIYEGNRYMFSTFDALEDFILDGKRTTLLMSPETECVRWDLENGESMFALANFTAERREVALPKCLADRRWRPFRGQRATGRALGPYEVVVGVTNERGAGLETYAETQALIDRTEHERTHRDNQILERYLDIDFVSSTGSMTFYKLVDGTRDVVGWLAKAKAPWVEFSFKKEPVRFSVLRLYGSGLDSVKVSVRKGGEWKGIAPRTVKAEKYMRELDFGEVQSTVKLRISFPSNAGSSVELYELELPRCGEGMAACPHAVATGAVDAQERVPPSADILWNFDAENAEWSSGWSPTRWHGGRKNPGVVPRADGGFTVLGKAIHSVRLDPDHPWVELEIDSFVHLGEKAYRAWLLSFEKCGWIAGGVMSPQTGLYVVRLPDFGAARKDNLTFYDYNLEIGVKRFRCVKRPMDFIVAEAADGADAIRPGGSVVVTLNLSAPCEDVTAMFLIDRGKGAGCVGFPINGTNAIDLKATNDGGGRVWKASVPVKSCGKADARRVYVKCAVLGGSLQTPLFTTIPQPFG